MLFFDSSILFILQINSYKNDIISWITLLAIKINNYFHDFVLQDFEQLVINRNFPMSILSFFIFKSLNETKAKKYPNKSAYLLGTLISVLILLDLICCEKRNANRMNIWMLQHLNLLKPDLIQKLLSVEETRYCNIVSMHRND